MTRIYYIEEKWYEFDQLSEVFSQEDLASLIVKGVLKSDDALLYKFTFVGVVSIRNIAFVILPKVLKKESDLLIDAKPTIQTLKKYSNLNFQKFDGIDYFESDPDNPNCSEMAIADELIDDFLRNGIYKIDEELLELNGNGDINWSETVLSTDPMFSRGGPVYFHTVNHVLIEDSKHLTVAIHKWSLGYCIKQYNILLGYDFGNIDLDYLENLNEIGSEDQLIRHLMTQLSVTFTDRGIRLLKSLIFLISAKSNVENNAINLYGTKKYENLWEAICKVTLNDIYPNFKNIYNFFPNPIWSIMGKKLYSKSHLIPDILTKNLETGKFYLFDAKYYMLQYDSDIKGEPGFKDILKQFQYQEHIEKVLGEEIGNSFLFPISDVNYNNLIHESNIIKFNDLMALIGYIDYALYPDKKINIIVCNYEKWQRLFLNNKSIDFLKILG